jgi:glycerophosphoryl diester phosphodiesterase
MKQTRVAFAIASFHCYFIFALFICLEACSGSENLDMCRQAADHVSECLGEDPYEVVRCHGQELEAAERYIEMSCDEILELSMPGKEDGIMCDLLDIGCDPPPPIQPNPDFLVIGHRGAPVVCAENTIDCLDRAVEIGANAIETDLCITKDHYVILWHDRDPNDTVALARQAGAEGLKYMPVVPSIGSDFRKPVDELTLEEFLANYGYGLHESLIADVLTDQDIDPNAPIALLDDFFDWVSGEAMMRAAYFDIKLAAEKPELVDVMFEKIVNAYVASQSHYYLSLYLMSPQRAIVEEFIGLAGNAEEDMPYLKVLRDFEEEGALEGTLELGLRDISTGKTPLRMWTAFKDEIQEIVDAREAGDIDSVTVWTIDYYWRMEFLMGQGVDGIMTNYPNLLHSIWINTL